MPTLTLKVSAELSARLERASRLRGVSKSEVTRRALEKDLSREKPGKRPSLYERMKDGFGCFDSGVTDLSTNKKYMEGFGKWKHPKL